MADKVEYFIEVNQNCFKQQYDWLNGKIIQCEDERDIADCFEILKLLGYVWEQHEKDYSAYLALQLLEKALFLENEAKEMILAIRKNAKDRYLWTTTADELSNIIADICIYRDKLV